MSSVNLVNRGQGVSLHGQQAQVSRSYAQQELLPSPEGALVEDDVLVSLAVAMVKLKREERLSNDRVMEAGSRAQQAAHQQKIDKMHELADDTLMEGIVSGALEGVGALASGVSAVTKFSSDMKEINAAPLKENYRTRDFAAKLANDSKALARDASLLDATAKGLSATSRFGSAACKAAQERDRTAMAEADAAKDAAKSTMESAASTVNRANEDIRATIAALRQLIAAKSQLANAAILRG